MRTEADLREAFEHLADSAPDPQQFAAALPLERRLSGGFERRLSPRRRTALILCATVATTAAAVAIPLALHDKPDSRPPVTTEQRKANDSWRSWLTITAPAGMEISSRFYALNYQVVGLRDRQANQGCLLTAHLHGQFNPAKIPAGSPRIDINGVSGYVVRRSAANPVITLPVTADPEAQSSKPTRMIIWQPSPGLWTTANCHVNHTDTTAAFDRAGSLAKAMSTSPQKLPSPYRIHSLPQGYIAAVTTPDGLDFTTQLSDGNPATGQYTVPGDPPWAFAGTLIGSDVRINFTTDEKRMGQPVNSPDTTINGLPVWWSPAMKGDPLPSGRPDLYVKGDGYAVWIRRVGDVPGNPELLELAKSIELATNPLDQSTWFDAAVAIP